MNDSPFVNLNSMTLPPIEKKSGVNSFRHNNEFGSLKKHNVRIENFIMSCAATNIIKNAFYSNPLCKQEVLCIKIDGFSLQLPENIHISICTYCGSRAQYTSKDISGGRIACANCSVRQEPKSQMLSSIAGAEYPPHYFCNIQHCGVAAHQTVTVLNSDLLVFQLMSLCETHARALKAARFALPTMEQVARKLSVQLNVYNSRISDRRDQFLNAAMI
jgi:hypothetical protein